MPMTVTANLTPGRKKVDGVAVEPLWWSAAQVEQALGISPNGRRSMMRRGLLSGIWAFGRGRGKPVRFDPAEVRLIALGQWSELKAYQDRMGRTKRRK